MSSRTGQYLDQNIFTTVISSTPLVSIDLVVINERNQVLLGKRLNRPAKGFWFVPGGRIYKNERIEEAFLRITQAELGRKISLSQATLIGPFTHLYDDFVFGEDTSTHYVVLGYQIKINQAELNPTEDDQHSGYQWFDIDNLVQQENVHTHTKWYFKS